RRSGGCVLHDRRHRSLSGRLFRRPRLAPIRGAFYAIRLLAGSGHFFELFYQIYRQSAPNTLALRGHAGPFIGFYEIGFKVLTTSGVEERQTVLGTAIAVSGRSFVPICCPLVVLLELACAKLVEGADAELRLGIVVIRRGLPFLHGPLVVT